MLKKSAVFIGAAMAAASLTLAGPAYASPAPAAGTQEAAATAAAAPGQLGGGGAKTVLSAQGADSHHGGARVGASTAAGAYIKTAVDGTVRTS
ncbi:hypothetical protein [Mycolicibacterium sp.]|uniref:hypothetical protein n=1 Tax=Mycolicibacterium sp. TaxID=2320850 RepID=UPI001D65C68F|nr:hypothetical protein [Mycolicibacterium sp.]MCB1290822.1 hypothetical protein [Mycobacterium sp.]MCB9409395.1 hypothetical protein [Mycolicibacterium sp.]